MQAIPSHGQANRPILRVDTLLENFHSTKVLTVEPGRIVSSVRELTSNKCTRDTRVLHPAIPASHIDWALFSAGSNPLAIWLRHRDGTGGSYPRLFSASPRPNLAN